MRRSCVKISDFHFIQNGALSSGNKAVYFVARPISVECLDSPAFQHFSLTKLIYGRYCNQSAPEWASKSCRSQAASKRIHQTRGWGELTHTHKHTPQAGILLLLLGTLAGTHARMSTHKHKLHCPTPVIHSHYQKGDTYCTHKRNDLLICVVVDWLITPIIRN